ncbi:hypothetical protein L218DRAFT_983998 [Marasmius fiardii PR-910]|nr:hypothetical protein L218DRAFT_983998 [Marasmius fiardii PR-910]
MAEAGNNREWASFLLHKTTQYMVPVRRGFTASDLLDHCNGPLYGLHKPFVYKPSFPEKRSEHLHRRSLLFKKSSTAAFHKLGLVYGPAAAGNCRIIHILHQAGDTIAMSLARTMFVEFNLVPLRLESARQNRSLKRESECLSIHLAVHIGIPYDA